MSNSEGMGSSVAFGKFSSSRISFAVKATSAGPRLETISMCSTVDLRRTSNTRSGMSRRARTEGGVRRRRATSNETFP